MGTIQTGWLIVVALLGAGVGFGIFISWALFLVCLAGAVAFVKSEWREVTEPDRAIHMRFGKYAGPLGYGWHLPIPGISDCCVIPGRPWEFDLPKETLFTAGETEIEASVFVTVHLATGDAALLNAALHLPTLKDWKRIEGMFQKIILSKVRTVVGNKDFRHLLGHQTDLEQEARTVLQNELLFYGFLVDEVEIYDFNEKVRSEAARIRAVGSAEADVIKEKAAAVKDNWQAALVAGVTEWARARERTAPSSSGKEKKKEEREDEKKAAGLADIAADAIRAAAGRKEE